MATKKQFLALDMMNEISATIEGEPVKVDLPKGCVGVCYVFKAKKHARKYFGHDVDLAVLKDKKT